MKVVSAQSRQSSPSLGALAPPLKAITACPQPQSWMQFVPDSFLGLTLCPSSARPPCSSGEPSCTCFLIRMPGAPHGPPPACRLPGGSSLISLPQSARPLMASQLIAPLFPARLVPPPGPSLPLTAPACPAHLALALRLCLGLQASEETGV